MERKAKGRAAAIATVILVSGFGLFLAAGPFGAAPASGAGAGHSLSAITAGNVSTDAGKGGCPNVNAIGNFLAASNVGATWTTNSTASTYYFSSLVDESPSGGIPGLIQYCVYPEAGLPNSTTVSAVGADGSAFTPVFGSVQGYFGYGRANGDPSNLPLDGSQNVLIGTATWLLGAPSNQTVLLHINDATICNGLYNDGSQTCFVYPSNSTPVLCNGDAVCKSIIVDEAYSQVPLQVPRDTVLHIHYTYVIVNQPTNKFDMEILAHNTYLTYGLTGAKDAFTCLQIPDPSGNPGALGLYKNYESTGLVLNFGHNGASCTHDLFTLTGGLKAVILHPGQSISFTVDMTTGPAGFPGHATWCINAGVTFRWFESDDGLFHSFHSPMVDVTVV